MKKICFVLLSLSLLVTLIPVNTFANTNQEKPKAKTTDIKIPTQKELKEVPNELEYIKQLIMEDLDSMYACFQDSEMCEDYTIYINEIQETALTTYNNCAEIVNNATTIEEIVDLDNSIFGLELVGELRDNYFALMYLLNFGDCVVNTSEDLKVVKNNYSKEINDFYDCFYKGDFNDYYWGRINGTIEYAKSKINAQTTFYNLAKSVSQVEDVLMERIPVYFNFSPEYYNYEQDCMFYEAELYEGDDIANALGVRELDYLYYDSYIYGNIGIKNAKITTTTLLNYYVTRQITTDNYDGDINILKEYVRTATNKINNSYNFNEMLNIYNNCINKMEKITGVKFKNFSVGETTLVNNRIDQIYAMYNDEDIYSSEALNEIHNIYYTLKDCVEMMGKRAELPNDYEARFIGLLDEIPTKVEELQAAKTKYINILKKFKNNVKYNQTKVVPIVNEGITKINQKTTIEGAKYAYKVYYNKALATIKKFNITTSKSGYGTISKSKVVKYGNSQSIYITPKAGYKISKLYVDGQSVKVTTKYTFKNVTKNHRIKAVFVLK